MGTFDFYTPLSQIGKNIGDAIDEGQKSSQRKAIGAKILAKDYDGAAKAAIEAGDLPTGLSLSKMGQSRESTAALGQLLGGLGLGGSNAGGTSSPTGKSASPLAPATPTSAPSGTQIGDITPDEDLAIRTTIGEAAGEGPDGWKAVAGVIGNRAKGSGMSLKDVVLAPNQFEPWGSRRAELLGYDPAGTKYQQVAGAILPILRGQENDPTGGATHFYAPRAQSALGRKAPSWDDGTGRDIGNHRFFALGYGGTGPGVNRHGVPLAGGDVRDDLSVPNDGPGVALAYKSPASGVAPVQTADAAPSPSAPGPASTQGAPPPAGVPTLNDWSKQMIADGLKTGPNKPIAMFIGAKEWDDYRPFFTNPDGSPLTVSQAAEKLRTGGQPTRLASATPEADLPAEGAREMQLVPGSASDSGPTTRPPLGSVKIPMADAKALQGGPDTAEARAAFDDKFGTGASLMVMKRPLGGGSPDSVSAPQAPQQPGGISQPSGAAPAAMSAGAPTTLARAGLPTPTVQGVAAYPVGSARRIEVLVRAAMLPGLSGEQTKVVDTLLRNELEQSKMPEGQKDYQLARTQGFAGTYLEYQREVARAKSVEKDDATPDIKNWREAVKGGYTGSLTEFITQVKKAGAPPEAENEEAKELGKERGKRAGAIEAAGSSASEQIAKLNVLQSLLEKASTGRLAGAEATAVGFAQALGVDPAQIGLNPNQAVTGEAAQKIINELVVGSIGKGGFPANNFSNADREFLQDIYPKLSNRPEANRIAIEVLRRTSQRNLEVADAWAEYQAAKREAKEKPSVADFEYQFRKKMRGQPDLFADLREQIGGMPAAGNGGKASPGQPGQGTGASPERPLPKGADRVQIPNGGSAAQAVSDAKDMLRLRPDLKPHLQEQLRQFGIDPRNLD